MKCPVCTNVDLTMSERQGIEIDYCPQYRGVWLDRGELDKIIERSTPSMQSEDRREQPQYESRERHHDDKHGSYGHGKHRRKSFFEELFD